MKRYDADRMGRFVVITLGVFAALLPVQVGAQNVGDSCVPTDNCNALLNEECDGSVCVCRAGYETIGGGNQCFAKDCGSLTSPINGNAVAYSAGTVFGSVAFYTCATGYEIDGSDSRTCQDDATWGGTDPTCVKKDCETLAVLPSAAQWTTHSPNAAEDNTLTDNCGALAVPPNGAIDNTATTYLEQVVFSCNTGYTLNGASTLTCTAAGTGTWSSASPTCDIVDCGILGTPENGGKDASSGTTYLATTTFTCNAGYDLIGSATRTCGADGQWTNTEVVCVIKDCGALTRDADGTLDFSSGTTFGSQATFACNAGFDLIGSSPLVCQADAMWSDDEPTCSIRDCGDLAEPVDGSRTYSSGTTYQSIATFSCDTGYDLMGIATINCLNTGNWDESPPVCVVKDCGTLTAPTNGGVTFNTGTTEYPTVATFTCNTGFSLMGGGTSTCQASGIWSNTGAICSIQTCSSLSSPTDGSVAYSQALNYASLAFFSCSLGHSLTGFGLSFCQENGMWNSSEPFCNINDCGDLNDPDNGAKITQDGTSYGSTITFTCNAGYDMVGSTFVTCQADGGWSDGPPVCNVKDCGSVMAPDDGTISSTTGTSYQNTITFSCSAGYTLTGSTTIVCGASGAWSNNPPTCVIKDCGTLLTPTNGQMSYSSGTVFESMATFSCDTGYTLVGTAVLNCAESGAWDGTIPTCPIVDCNALSDPGNGGQTTPTTTYQSTATFTCDSGYTLTGSATSVCQATGSWSNPIPTCVINDCGGLSTPSNGAMNNPTGLTTYLTTVTFTCNTGYDLIGSTSLLCQADANWNTAIPICDIRDCGALVPPSDGNVDTSGGTTYLSVATYTCNTGYTHNGADQRTCQSDGTWSATPPTCEIVDCNALAAPNFGSLTLPGGTTYQSIAIFDCDLGYTLVGDNTRTCQDDFDWSSATPVCEINDCGSLASPTNGAVATPDGTTYTEVATFTCDTGYTLDGVTQRTCQANSDWSNTSPVCNINDCGNLAAPTNGQVFYGGTVYLSVAAFTCDAGYTLTGEASRTCQADGNWETPSPTCIIKDCGALADPADGTVDTSDGTVYQSVANYTCDAGYNLVGVTSRTCTDAGTWDNAAPTCTRKDCGGLSAPVDGTVDLTQGTLFEANATFVCDTGYTLNGMTVRTCEDTGTWNLVSPTCVINDCGSLLAPVNGSAITAGGTTYQEVAIYDCDPGFTLTGTDMRVCQANSNWNDTAPTCIIKDCGTLAAPADGSVTYNPNTEYQATANFTCDTGYTLNGADSRECVASGMWDAATPVCDINDCGVLSSPADGSVNQTDGTTYLSTSYFMCDTGYTLNGVVSRLCQANSTWSDISPVCIINDCGSISDPGNGTVDLADGTVYQSVAIFECDMGYNLVGVANRECLAPGDWEMPFPFCQIKDCGIPATPQFGSVNISGATTYLSNISYSCEDGFDLSGSEVRTCASDGNWTDEDPQCLRRDCGNLTALEFGEIIYLNYGTLFEGIAEYNCSLGYNLTDGDRYRVCQENMTWNGSAPICITEDCGPVTNPTNGQVSTPGGTTFLQTAYYTCDVGYDLDGVSERTCADVGGHAVWTDFEPTCVIRDCGVLADPNNGAVDISSGTTYGSQAPYSCITGYVVTGLANRVCQGDGTWSGDPPTCELIDCGAPTNISNGAATTDGGTLYQATGIYACDTGYGLVGSAEVTCLATGDWDSTPSCSTDCGTPPTVDQSTVSNPSGSLVGATATYTCDDGYSMSGNATITCSSVGMWSTEPFCAIVLRDYNETCFLTAQCITVGATCRDNGRGADQCICALQGEYYDTGIDECLAVGATCRDNRRGADQCIFALQGEYYDQGIDECLADCGTLPDPTNGVITLPAVTSAGEVVVYACYFGYALSGVAVRTCLSTGVWSDSAPICITGCPTLDHPDNGYVNTSTGRVAGDIAYYSCNQGYSLVGSEQRVCLEDSTWNNNPPTCNIECPRLGHIDHGSVDQSLGNWQGSYAIYICEKDYALVGTSLRTCQSTALWTGASPECIFAIFPDILLAFGIVLIILVIVDIAVLSFCLYIRFCKPKKNDEDDMSYLEGKDPSMAGTIEPGYPTIFEEKPAVSIPPMMSTNMRNSGRNSGRKPRPARITPEGTKNHPPPRKPKIDRPLYKYTVKPKTEIPDPGAGQQRQQGNRSSRELQLEDFNRDDPMLSDDSRKGAPDEDQISLFDAPNADPPTQRWDSPEELSARPSKAPTLASEVQEHGNIRARMSVPAVPDPPVPIQNESEKFYSEERRKYMRTSMNAYAKK